MRTRRVFPLIVMSAVLSVCYVSEAEETKAVKLGSVEECQQKYLRLLVTNHVNGIECFYGARKINSGHESQKEIFKFDTTRLEVSPLLSRENFAKYFSQGFGELKIDPSGQWAVATPCAASAKSMSLGIMLIALDDGECRMLVSDQQRNYALSVSPDGRFIAYYSTDPSMGWEPEKAIPHSAGRVVEVATGKVATYTNHFMDKGEWVFGYEPIWLDNERVLFCTFTSDSEVIKKSGADPSVHKYPYAAIAHLATEKVEGLLIPDGNQPPRAFVDRQNRDIIFSSQMHLVVKTDFNLAGKSTVVETKEPRRVRVYGFKEDGSLNYAIREYKKQEPPRELFE